MYACALPDQTNFSTAVHDRNEYKMKHTHNHEQAENHTQTFHLNLRWRKMIVINEQSRPKHILFKNILKEPVIVCNEFHAFDSAFCSESIFVTAGNRHDSRPDIKNVTNRDYKCCE